MRPSRNLARVIHPKKAPVIFEQSERPALHVRLFPVKKGLRMPGRFFASLKKDGYLSTRGSEARLAFASS